MRPPRNGAGGGAGGTGDPAFALSGGGGGGSSYGPTGTTYTTTIDRALVIIYLPADVTKPTVTITTPASDATYTVGAKVVVNFACADETSLASCSGTSPNGSLLDTSVAQVGGHTFTVTGVDKAGNSSSLTRRPRRIGGATAP